jgi:O-antigen ligase
MVALSKGRRKGVLDEARLPWIRFGLFAGFVFLCMLGGGGARADILSLLYVRPAAILLVAAMLVLPGKVDLKSVLVPLLLCLAFCALMAAQLVPLPPPVWQALPGRALFAEAASLSGQPQPWRPLSIAPDLTLNSLAAMVVPVAGLLGFAALDGHRRRLLLPVLIGAALLSALLGFLQLSGGANSPFYLYRVTNDDSAVGLFANRNHNAALLAMALPMLATWAATGPGPLRLKGTRTIAAAAAGVFLVSAIISTTSRAGLGFGALGALAAWVLYVQQARIAGELRKGWRAILLGLGAIAGMVVALALLQRASSLERLFGDEAGSDWRTQNFGYLTKLAGDMQPLGTGFGAFDPFWRIHEPHGSLTPQYLNHAHNDLIELAITGGLPALALLGAGLVWLLLAIWRVVRPWRAAERHILFARLGAAMLAILLLWSLIDYPLRTPSLALAAAVAAGWLGSGARRRPVPAPADGGAPAPAA